MEYKIMEKSGVIKWSGGEWSGMEESGMKKSELIRVDQVK